MIITINNQVETYKHIAMLVASASYFAYQSIVKDTNIIKFDGWVLGYSDQLGGYIKYRYSLAPSIQNWLTGLTDELEEN